MAANRRQAGQALPIVLMALGMGALLMGPLLNYVSVTLTNLQKGTGTVDEYYAADSGSEHAIWQVAYGGLTMEVEDPFTYALSAVNNLNVDITITNKSASTSAECSGSEAGGGSDRVTVLRTVQPLTAPAGVPTTFSFSIRFSNVGTGNLHFSEIGYTLPQGFTYTNGSASGVTVSDPQLVDGSLIWGFEPPLPEIASGGELTEDFQAVGTLDEGVYCDYCDAAWVVFQPASVGCVVYRAGEKYNIRSIAGSVYVQAAVLISGGTVTVLSWDTK